MLKNTNQSSITLSNNLSTYNQSLNSSDNVEFNSIDADIGNFNQLILNNISQNNSITQILGLQGSNIVYKNDILDLGSNQIITGVKTFSLAPVISTINNIGILTLPTNTDTLIGRNTNDALTTKTINSAVNTLTITNSPLVNTNINLLINQDLRAIVLSGALIFY
jgi:hypothetical protein